MFLVQIHLNNIFLIIMFECNHLHIQELRRQKLLLPLFRQQLLLSLLRQQPHQQLLMLLRKLLLLFFLLLLLKNVKLIRIWVVIMMLLLKTYLLRLGSIVTQWVFLEVLDEFWVLIVLKIIILILCVFQISVFLFWGITKVYQMVLIKIIHF